MSESNPRPPEIQASIGAALPPNFITIAAVITGLDEAGVWHGRAPRGNGADAAPAGKKGKDPNDLVVEGAYLPSITDTDPGLPIDPADLVPTDLSLGEDYENHGAYEEHVEPPPISEDAYFALTDGEKLEVPRDMQGRPFGYWSWSKEAWNRYYQENPRTPNAGPPRESVNAGTPRQDSYREQEPRKITASPYVWRDPKMISAGVPFSPIGAFALCGL